MTENSAVCNNPSIETVKRLLLEDLHQSFVFDTNQQESTFCEVEDVVPRKIEVSRTYSRQTPRKTPNKRVLRSLENTLYSMRDSPNTTHKHKRKKVDEEDDVANKSIIEITEQFKKVEDFQLAVE